MGRLNTKRERNLLFLDDPKDPMMFLAMASELHLLARSALRALAEYNGPHGWPPRHRVDSGPAAVPSA